MLPIMLYLLTLMFSFSSALLLLALQREWVFISYAGGFALHLVGTGLFATATHILWKKRPHAERFAFAASLLTWLVSAWPIEQLLWAWGSAITYFIGGGFYFVLLPLTTIFSLVASIRTFKKGDRPQVSVGLASNIKASKKSRQKVVEREPEGDEMPSATKPEGKKENRKWLAAFAVLILLVTCFACYIPRVYSWSVARGRLVLFPLDTAISETVRDTDSDEGLHPLPTATYAQQETPSPPPCDDSEQLDLVFSYQLCTLLCDGEIADCVLLQDGEYLGIFAEHCGTGACGWTCPVPVLAVEYYEGVRYLAITEDFYMDSDRNEWDTHVIFTLCGSECAPRHISIELTSSCGTLLSEATFQFDCTKENPLHCQ